jgi:2-amino-4-hydroxy-6-hydroxymethyldihydropteridine diphosphokinase
MKAVIALGANMGNPQENIDLAIALLREATDIQAISSMYRTAPVGGPEQPDYINAVVLAESELPATDFLNMLHGIEKTLGRERTIHWGPRTIDLDLIQYGSILSSSQELLLPHPRAHERRFVLEPWLEVDPDAHLLTHGPVEHLLSALLESEQ